MAGSDVGGTWLCKVEEMKREGVHQIGQSACGPTAIINILKACGVKKLPSVDTVLKTTPARQRDYDTRSLHGYLLSRVKAGTTHVDLIEGIDKLSNGEVVGQLYTIDAHATPDSLSDWLANWMSMGGVPALTLNLFLDGQDAFHHQTVFGVEKGGDVWASNPVKKYKPAHLLSLLTDGGHMIIPKDHILWRFQEAFKDGTAQAFLAEVERLDREQPWMRFGVGSQINRMLGNLTQGQQEEAWKRRFSDLIIPWGGIPGVIIFAKKGSPAEKELQAGSDDHVEIAMPVYGITERVPVALSQRLEDGEKRQEAATLAATLALVQEEKHSMKELLASEASAKRRLESNLSAEREGREQVASDLSKQKSVNDQLQGRLQAAIADNAQLASRLEAADADAASLREAMHGARAEVSKLKSDVTLLEGKVQHRDESLAEARAEVQQLRTELQTQCQDTASLAQEMADLVNEYKAQARMSGDSARKVEEMSAELSYLRAQQHGDRAKALEERKLLLGQIEDLKRKLHIND